MHPLHQHRPPPHPLPEGHHMKLIASVLIAALACSCSWFSSKESTIAQTVQACATADLGQPITLAGVTASLSLQVTEIIAAGADGWEAALEALGVKVGEDALLCAVQATEALFRSPATPDAGVSTSDGAPTVDQQFPGAHDRAAQYLATHGKK